MRFLIHFSYDGSLFHGYQTQPGYRTVQEELENAAIDGMMKYHNLQVVVVHQVIYLIVVH